MKHFMVKQIHNGHDMNTRTTSLSLVLTGAEAGTIIMIDLDTVDVHVFCWTAIMSRVKLTHHVPFMFFAFSTVIISAPIKELNSNPFCILRQVIF